MSGNSGATKAHGTLVVFGGFDSYIEELFPILASFQRNWAERDVWVGVRSVHDGNFAQNGLMALM